MSFAVVGGSLAAAGGITSFVGGIMGGSAAKQQADQKAAMDEQNAAAAGEEGTVKLTNQQRGAAQTIGAEKANYASSGIQIGNGSASQMIQNSTYQAALDSAQISYETNARISQYSESAANELQYGEAAQTGADIGAAGSLLSGLGSAAGVAGKAAGPATASVPNALGAGQTEALNNYSFDSVSGAGSMNGDGYIDGGFVNGSVA